MEMLLHKLSRQSAEVNFYNDTGGLLASHNSNVVPRVGEYISIRKQIWLIESVSWALDDADDPVMTRLRASVDMTKIK